MVSIIVPNYNHARFLPERLNSIFNQTFQDYEVILLDDASTDDSLKILEAYASHPKVSHFIVNEENSGSPFRQWKKGIELAKGKYVWVAESDDSNNVEFVEELLSQAEKHENVGLVFSGLEIIENNEVSEFIPLIEGYYEGEYLLKSFLYKGNIIRNGSSVLFEKSNLSSKVLEELEDFRIGGDWFVWSTILKTQNCVFVEKCLTRYNKHTNSTTFELKSNSDFYEEAIRISRYIVDSFESRNSKLNCFAYSHWKKSIQKSDLQKDEKTLMTAKLKDSIRCNNVYCILLRIYKKVLFKLS